jgi:hypothetical protein
MWLWSTLFELLRSAGRGLARLYIGAIMLMFTLAGIGAFVMQGARENPEEAAALAVSAATDLDHDEAREWVRDSHGRRTQRGSVAAQWERDRREDELDQAMRSAYDDDY